jgi:hypothetical protein
LRPIELRPIELRPIEPPPNQEHFFRASGTLCCFKQPFAGFGRVLCSGGVLTAGGSDTHGVRLDRSGANVHGALPDWERRNPVATFAMSK